jgi:hypothetical protein
MTKETIIVALISSLLSGLVGVLVSFYFFNRLEKRKLKTETARKMFASKHDIASSAFNEAMNEVMIVFSDSDEVISAMEELWQTLNTPISSRAPSAADEKLVKLMKCMCRDIGIEHKKLPDAYYLRYFRA